MCGLSYHSGILNRLLLSSGSVPPWTIRVQCRHSGRSGYSRLARHFGLWRGAERGVNRQTRPADRSVARQRRNGRHLSLFLGDVRRTGGSGCLADCLDQDVQASRATGRLDSSCWHDYGPGQGAFGINRTAAPGAADWNGRY